MTERIAEASPRLKARIAGILYLAIIVVAASAQTATIRVQSSLVLVDVISQDLKRGLPVRDFKKEDFRMFDNRHEVRIATFDTGADTRPITLWLVVICNERGIVGASAEFVGKESLFRPALDHLEKHDTVELLIGATTARPSSICCPPQTATVPSACWPN